MWHLLLQSKWLKSGSAEDHCASLVSLALPLQFTQDLEHQKVGAL